MGPRCHRERRAVDGELRSRGPISASGLLPASGACFPAPDRNTTIRTPEDPPDSISGACQPPTRSGPQSGRAKPPTSVTAGSGGQPARHPLVNYNYLSTDFLNHYGLNLNNPADLATLLAPIGSAAAGRFQNQLPFAGFPLTATVAQSLAAVSAVHRRLERRQPAAGRHLVQLAPDLPANKRFSHGLQFTFGFTWSKSLDTFGGTPGRSEPRPGQGGRLAWTNRW